MRSLVQSTARNVLVFLVDSTDHITGKTGMSAGLTITESKAGGAFASTTPTVTERGSGWYSLALTTTNTNTLGDYALHITAAGADPIDVAMQVIAINIADAVRGGMTALPNANAEAAGGLFTRGAGAGQINQANNGNVDVNLTRWVGTVPFGLSAQRVEVSVGAMQTDVVNATALAASAVTEIQTGLATSTALATVAGYVDTEIGTLQSAVSAIPTNPLLTNDARLNNLDAAISTRATAATVWSQVLDANAPVNARTALEIVNICVAILAGQATDLDSTYAIKSTGGNRTRASGTVSGDDRTPSSLDGRE